MALAVAIRVDFVDGSGQASHTTLHVPTGFSIAQYLEFGVAAVDLFKAISTCRISGASICVPLDLATATIKAVPTAIADIAEKAMFIFSSVVAGFKRKLKLPAIASSIFASGTDEVDQADVDVAAFSSAMVNGIAVTGGTISPSDARDNDLDDLATSRKLFRRL